MDQLSSGSEEKDAVSAIQSLFISWGLAQLKSTNCYLNVHLYQGIRVPIVYFAIVAIRSTIHSLSVCSRATDCACTLSQPAA